MTTGKSSLEAVAAVREHGARVIGVLTVVNRSADPALFEREALPLLWVFTGEELLTAARG